MTDNKDEVIQALQEMIQELMSKLINLRVATGLKIKELESQLKNKND